MKHIINVGEILIDIIPTAQVRLGQLCYSPYAGGAIANVAVAIARLGGSSRFTGGIAEDRFGQLLLQVLIDNQVDTQYVCMVKGAATAVALVTLETGGQRHFTFFRQGTADTRLQADDLNWNAWNDAAICHGGGVLLSTEPARSATFAAMEYTRKAGSIVSFDANIRPPLWSSSADMRETIGRAVERADIVKLSVEEVELLAGSAHGAAALSRKERLRTLGEAILERGPRLVIITLGASGALLLTARHHVEVASLPVRPVDTTGAGDAFIGALLYKLVQQEIAIPSDLDSLSEDDLNDLGRFANRIASFSVTRYGGISSFPFMHEVRDLR